MINKIRNSNEKKTYGCMKVVILIKNRVHF